MSANSYDPARKYRCLEHKRLQRVRKMAGWRSQQAFAKAAGFGVDSRTTPSRIERGQPVRGDSVSLYLQTLRATRRFNELSDETFQRVLDALEGIPFEEIPDGAVHNLPPDPGERLFIGRSLELAALREALAPRAARAPGSPVLVVDLHGMAGIGKSHLALRYAYAELSAYRHLLWVDAMGADTTANVAGLAATLALRLPASATAADQAAAVRQHLQSSEAPSLLILDNVEDPRAWRRWLPTTGQTRVLLTSRRRLRDRDVRSIAVEALPADRALALLCGAAEYEGDELAAAQSLCEDLGAHTLGLAVSRALLEADELGAQRTPSQLLEAIRAAGPIAFFEGLDDDLPEGGPPFGRRPVERAPGLAALFALSLRQLQPDRPVDAAATAMLHVAGWFAPTPVAWPLLVGAALEYRGRAPDALRDQQAGAKLVRLNLAHHGAGGLRFHRLLQLWLRGLGGPRAREAVTRAVATLAWETPTEVMAVRALAPHREHLEIVSGYLGPGSPPRHFRIPLRLAQNLREFSLYERASEVVEAALAQCEDDQWRSDLLNIHGLTLERLGRYPQARERFQSALALKRALLGEEHSELATTLSNIGQTYRYEDRREQALDYFQRALAIQDRLLGEHIETASSLNNIGLTLIQLARYEEARAALQRALAIVRPLSDQPTPPVAALLNNIGRTLLKQRRHEEALDYFQRSLDIIRTLVGDEHSDTAINAFNLGEVLRATGREEEGLGAMRAALETMRRLLGPDHPLVSAMEGRLEGGPA